MRGRVWQAAHLGLTAITLDTEATVHTLFGNQMGGRKGYNPKNKGKKSYQPILTFLAETREYVSGGLHNGDCHTGPEMARHLKDVFAALPAQVETILARADSGFYGGHAVAAYEDRGVQFIISARKAARLIEELKAADWKRSPRTDAHGQCEFSYQPGGWGKAYRFIALRYKKKPKPAVADEPEQYQLFDTPEYTYRVFVTNMKRAVDLLVWFYDQRAQDTLFLDEIGEIPLELQPKLLRALEEQELERLGGNRTIRVDVRIIAATNRDLKQMVEEGKFRADLYFRLHVFPLNVPALRERREDIPLLTRCFVQNHGQLLGRKVETIPTSAPEAITRHDWPGNVRELQNVIERSIILTSGSVLQVAMPDFMNRAAPAALHSRSSESSEAAERDRILKALVDAKGQVGGPDGAAARLGLKRTTLQSRMRKFSIARQYR